MWSSSGSLKPRISRLARGALVVTLIATALSGCSGFTPVYGERGLSTTSFDFTYNKPGNRLAQIVIKDLELRLGKSRGGDGPEITISAAAGHRQLNQSNAAGGKPTSEYMATVIVTYTVTRDDQVVAQGTRRATAQYTTVGQVLADVSAAEDAEGRAAREAAETVRLSILAQLGTPQRT